MQMVHSPTPPPDRSYQLLHFSKCEIERAFLSASHHLLFSFARYDYVEVIDGENEGGRLWGKFCGKIAPSPVVSSGPFLFIKFVSDYETHGAGFSIRYEIFKRGK
jgi:hypothetical protein